MPAWFDLPVVSTPRSLRRQQLQLEKQQKMQVVHGGAHALFSDARGTPWKDDPAAGNRGPGKRVPGADGLSDLGTGKFGDASFTNSPTHAMSRATRHGSGRGSSENARRGSSSNNNGPRSRSNSTTTLPADAERGMLTALALGASPSTAAVASSLLQPQQQFSGTAPQSRQQLRHSVSAASTSHPSPGLGRLAVHAVGAHALSPLDPAVAEEAYNVRRGVVQPLSPAGERLDRAVTAFANQFLLTHDKPSIPVLSPLERYRQQRQDIIASLQASLPSQEALGKMRRTAGGEGVPSPTRRDRPTSSPTKRGGD